MIPKLLLTAVKPLLEQWRGLQTSIDGSRRAW